MHGRRIDSFLITDNLRLEIIHESNPYYAGEPISLVVRIKHLGTQDELTSLKNGIKKLHQKIQTSEPDSLREEQKATWSMKSLLDAFKGGQQEDGDVSQAEKEVDERLQELISKQLQFHKPLELMSGYCQISGVFQFDPEIIDESKMKNVGSKMVGISDVLKQENGSDVSAFNGSDSSLAKYYNSKHNPLAVGTGSVVDEHAGLSGEGNAVFALGHMAGGVEYGSVPIFLIPQTLLFSEITLEPGKMKSYRFKSACLPRDLAPSYNISKNFAVSYNLEFGVSRLIHGEIKQHVIRVPITLAPYISSSGCQLTSSLDHPPSIFEPADVKEIKQKPHAQKRSSTTSLGHISRRSSTFMTTQAKNNDTGGAIRNFVSLVESNEDGFENIDDLVDSQIEKQFGEDKGASDELSNSFNDQSDESLRHYISKRAELVQNNVSRLVSLFGKGETGPEVNSKSDEIPQLTNLQKSYQINWNGQPITKLLLSKPFFTTSQDIDLVLELDSSLSSMHKVSAVNVSLESYELINRNYAADANALTKPRGHQIYECRTICFDECRRVPLKLLIPRNPTHQVPSQFKTDIFQFKWMLTLRFVLIPRSETYLERFYEDAKGTLLHAKETIEGESFLCHIPLIILPTAHTFGGW
ncbi:hypothetical protein HG536_0C01500 [Torulaspora globosa]|uniref:Rgp1-domain-containing protein n=1 Tax=Torulaspora globosa TaxID=48254 RepID=A0A7G3ZEP6_9SACH|nr:uncharacterized protein HG536_0C01500 [Torulaspora globosa]QLL31982.1 hypothetical protein HG536_0C01500 [Torulaspora globosa]